MAKLVTMGSFRLEFPEGTEYTATLSRWMIEAVFEALDKKFPEALIEIVTDYQPHPRSTCYCGGHLGNHPKLDIGGQ